MATYSRRERTTTRVEFPVPAEPPYGTAWVEVMKAIHAAHTELRDAGVIPAGDRDAPDDAILIRSDDDEIVVYYEREATS